MKMIQKMLLCFMAIWLCASPVFAGPLDKAKEAFSSGDFKKAGKLASKAGKKLKSKSEKAEALVIAGASAMKQGKSGKSKFKKALKLDPNVTLPSEAEGDKKIAKAFASAQKKAGTNVSTGSSSGASSDKLTKSASRVDKSPGNIKNYIPVGINNFLQGKTITAVATAGLQVGGLFLFLNRKQAAADADKDAKSVIADAETNSETENEKFQKFLSDNDAFVKKANSEATLALAMMAGGYAISVIDALFDPLGTAKVASDDSQNKQTYANLGSDFESRKIDSSWKVDFQILPAREPGLMLSMKQNF
ncbi:MAG: hypothetical protein EOP04_18240 [Proteobacteria bacterium]|nr:MAG: hypothetical protein EOP04_18240 [Pseudomonadota bacterium]